MAHIQSPGVWEEMKRLLAGCIAVVACPLFRSTEGSIRCYHSPMQQLSKVQTDALRKARREAAKVQKKYTALDLVLDPDQDDPAKDPDLQDEGSLEGVSLLLVCRFNSQALSKYARRAAASNPAAAAAIARAGSISDPDPPSAEDSNLGLAFYIPLDQTSKDQQQGLNQDRLVSGSAAPTAPSPLQILQDVILSGRPIVCCDVKRLLRDLLRMGVEVPEGLKVADPCLLAWLSDPQQVGGCQGSLAYVATARLPA